VTSSGERVWEQRFPTTADGIAAFVARAAAPWHVAVEASGPTWAFADQIVGYASSLRIVDAGKTRLRAGYAAKTDRLDARRLADALRRDSVVGIYYPPMAIRELRELCRYRATLVRMARSLKQRVQALLLREGVQAPAVSDLFGRAGTAWLTALHLGGWAQASLAGLRELLTQVQAQLAAADAAVGAEAARDPIVQRLQQIRGVGPVLGLMIRAEIGEIARFASAAHLASYAGLVPRVDRSASRCIYGRLTKHGSPWLRWALIEAAMHGPQRADAVGRWARKLSLKKGALKARGAIARALCKDVMTHWRAAL
jgi:transposase